MHDDEELPPHSRWVVRPPRRQPVSAAGRIVGYAISMAVGAGLGAVVFLFSFDHHTIHSVGPTQVVIGAVLGAVGGLLCARGSFGSRRRKG